MFVLIVALALAGVAAANEAVASKQLREYLEEHKEPAGNLFTEYGYPLTYDEANFGIYRDSSLLLNPYIYESISHFSLERIPLRSVHADGAGARGYFEVTHDVSHIISAKVFNTIGKKTPVFVRFSLTSGSSGSNEVTMRNKGFSIKFYTEEGNLDFPAFAITAFALKDPVYSAGFVHSFNPNPKTGVLDASSSWDFIATHPSALHGSMQPFGLIGQTKGYQNLPGHALHTYQIENDKGEVFFAKFNWFPNAGLEYLNSTEIATIAASNADYFTQYLYDSIANGSYPSWTFCMQVVPAADLGKMTFDIFDLTLDWPAEDFENIPIGTFTLNKNPENYFAEVEQIGFNPGNLVPGIRGCDKTIEARTFIYRDSQIHRLGVGFNKIPVNCPLNKPMTYVRDGAAPVNDNGGDSPNYYPNSFNGIVPKNKKLAPLYRPISDPGATNLWQVAKTYNEMSDYGKEVFVTNVGTSLNAAAPVVQEKILDLFNRADTCLAERIKGVMANATASSG